MLPGMCTQVARRLNFASSRLSANIDRPIPLYDHDIDLSEAVRRAVGNIVRRDSLHEGNLFITSVFRNILKSTCPNFKHTWDVRAVMPNSAKCQNTHRTKIKMTSVRECPKRQDGQNAKMPELPKCPKHEKWPNTQNCPMGKASNCPNLKIPKCRKCQNAKMIDIQKKPKWETVKNA